VGDFGERRTITESKIARQRAQGNYKNQRQLASVYREIASCGGDGPSVASTPWGALLAVRSAELAVGLAICAPTTVAGAVAEVAPTPSEPTPSDTRCPGPRSAHAPANHSRGH